MGNLESHEILKVTFFSHEELQKKYSLCKNNCCFEVSDPGNRTVNPEQVKSSTIN